MAISVLVERARILVDEKISLIKNDYKKSIETKQSHENRSGALK